jgi:glycosyltransferase involved in cell wall biosynthesis
MKLRAVAVLWAYNEADFAAHCIRHLLSEGIDVQVFDNYSTDDTFEILRGFGSQIKCARWPAEYEECTSLTARLKYLEDYSLRSKYDWLINHDLDEIRRTRTGERVIDFIARMDAFGFNAIDHEIQVFEPREGWDGTQNPEEFFTTRVLGHEDELSPHIKAWEQRTGEFSFDYGTPTGRKQAQANGVNLWVCGGHQAIFPDRRVAPEKLLLKHYPLRTQAHAERKIAERKRSYTEEELTRGWHRQYGEEWWKV